MGPALGQLFGRPIAGRADFEYSDALKSRSGVWNAATLDAWLSMPRQFAPGNKMSFSGISDPVKRVALIAYLQSATAPQGK